MKNILLGILFGFILIAGCVEETPMPQPPIGSPDEPEAEPECNTDTDCNEAFICADGECVLKLISRVEAIPDDAVKITLETDKAPPILYSDEYEEPIAMPEPITTAGAEDSAFMMPDGNTFYFVFVPDVRVPVEKQILDGSSGMYMSQKINGEWSEPERVVLNDDISLDGCHFVHGDFMLFCSVRAPYAGIHWYSAEYIDGKWTNWKNVDDVVKTEEYETGELHISSDGNELYFHSYREGGKGGMDIWVSRKVDGEWGEPENVEAVNTERDDGFPALSPDDSELWISRDYGIWRSKKVNGTWTEPEKIVSPLAGEASIDNEGNVYFTHHFYDNDVMLEADIYVIRKK